MLIAADTESSRAFATAAEFNASLNAGLQFISRGTGETHITVNDVRMNLGGRPMISVAASIKRGKDVIVGMSEPIQPPVGSSASVMMRDMRTRAAMQALEKLRV